MVFFLKARNRMTKPKISNRRKQLLELMRSRGRPIYPEKKQFVYNEMLNIRRDPVPPPSVVMTGDDVPVAVVEPVPMASASEEAKKTSKTNSDRMTIIKRLFEDVEDLPFNISPRISKPQMNSMISFLDDHQGLSPEKITQLKRLKRIDEKVNFLYDNINNIQLPKKFDIGTEETKQEPKTPGKKKSKKNKTPTTK